MGANSLSSMEECPAKDWWVCHVENDMVVREILRELLFFTWWIILLSTSLKSRGLSCWIVKASEGKPKSVGTTHLNGFADPTHLQKRTLNLNLQYRSYPWPHNNQSNAWHMQTHTPFSHEEGNEVINLFAKQGFRVKNSQHIPNTPIIKGVHSTRQIIGWLSTRLMCWT